MVSGSRVKRPWRKKPWPRVLSDGSKRYVLNYRDHEGRVRSAGASFRTISAAKAWSDAYEEAVRYGQLREFLLGPDREPRDDITLAELIADWLAFDVDPEVEHGLARSTFQSYLAVAGKHIIGTEVHDRRGKLVRGRMPYAIGHLPAASFSEPGPIRRWLDGMRAARVSAATQTRAFRVLSSALSWAAERDDYPVTVNGCRLLERNRTSRRSSRRALSAEARRRAARRKAPANWALGPEAVERVRYALVHHPDFRRRAEVNRWRDATIVALQYGLGDRNQEAPGLRWADIDFVAGEAVHEDVVSMDGLGEGKTSGATRRTPLPATTVTVLLDWRSRAAAAGLPTRGSDFVIPGAAREGHLTVSQGRLFGQRAWKDAVELVAASHDHLADIRGATLYALRRGAISLRLRAGADESTVANECGTSLQMLREHYRFALDAYRADGPIDADAERQAAYELVWGTGRRPRSLAPVVGQ